MVGGNHGRVLGGPVAQLVSIGPPGCSMSGFRYRECRDFRDVRWHELSICGYVVWCKMA